MIVPFENIEDLDYFETLFKMHGGVKSNADYFDFREPTIKRKEFNKLAKKVRDELISKYGLVCQLNLISSCTNTPDHVDHFIPLSSNELNKKLRHMGTSKVDGKVKKAPTQSFGSNHNVNFVLACAKCNNHKKHRFPSAETIEHIFNQRSGND